jgi:uncharacterized protein
VVDYRGYGISEGSPSIPSLAADALCVYRQARDVLAANDAGRGKLFVMGRSIGSAAAIEIAAAAGAGIDGLIIDSGFAFTMPLLGSLKDPRFVQATEEKDGFGSLEKIAAARAPTLIIHGEADRLLPVNNGKALYERCGAADKKLLVIPGARHNTLISTERRAYFRAIRALVFPQQ